MKMLSGTTIQCLITSPLSRIQKTSTVTAHLAPVSKAPLIKGCTLTKPQQSRLRWGVRMMPTRDQHFRRYLACLSSKHALHSACRHQAAVRWKPMDRWTWNDCALGYVTAICCSHQVRSASVDVYNMYAVRMTLPVLRLIYPQRSSVRMLRIVCVSPHRKDAQPLCDRFP